MLRIFEKLTNIALNEVKERVIKRGHKQHQVVYWLKELGFPTNLKDSFESIYIHSLAKYHIEYDPYDLVRILSSTPVQLAFEKKIFYGIGNHGLIEAIRRELQQYEDIHSVFPTVDSLIKQLSYFEEILLSTKQVVTPASQIQLEHQLKTIGKQLDPTYSFDIQAKLFEGSRNFYFNLTNPNGNGRFRYLSTSELLLTKVNFKTNKITNEDGGQDLYLFEGLEYLWGKSKKKRPSFWRRRNGKNSIINEFMGTILSYK